MSYFEGKQTGANVLTRSTSKLVKVGSRVIILSKAYKKGRAKIGGARGRIMKKFKKVVKNQIQGKKHMHRSANKKYTYRHLTEKDIPDSYLIPKV